MHELGLLQEFVKLPHGKLHHVSAVVGTTSVQIADFTHLPTQCRYIALMPQWDFLNFLAKQGARYPAFDLRMKAEVTQLIEQDGLTSACAQRRRQVNWQLRPRLSSVPTVGIRPCANAPAAAAHSGADRRDGIPSRAHCHAERGRRGSA